MMNRVTAPAALLLGSLLVAPLAQAEVNVSVEAGLRQEDNIGLANNSSDEFDDFTMHLGLVADWMISQTPTSEFELTSGVGYDQVDDIGDLSRWEFEAGARYRGQASADLTAVWWQLEVGGAILSYKDSDIRDGYTVEAAATLGKRFNERFGLSAGYRFELRRSEDDSLQGQAMTWNPTDVFDLEKNGAFVRGEFTLGPDTMIFGEYNYKTGDEASTGRFGMLGSTIDWAWDPAFGPGFQVWQIDVDQNVFDVGIDHQFSDKFGVEFAVSYLDADGDAGGWGDPQYENFVFTLIASIGF